MIIEQDKIRLLQSDQFQYMIETVGKESWITVYSHAKTGLDTLTYFSALIPRSKAEATLDDVSWDHHIGHGRPGIVSYYKDNKEINRYYRFGDDDGIEPLIFKRNFNDIRPAYTEISEEFRLYHNLYHDHATKKYILIDENGDEHDAIVYTEWSAKIKLSLLKEFLKIKKMLLAIYIDSTRWSSYSMSELGLSEVRKDVREAQYRLNLFVGHSDGGFGDDERKTLSRLIGKRLISGATKARTNGKKDDFPAFLIGVDEDGEPLSYSCDPDKLRNYFGANADAPSYLTPVFFRREVLNKYYSNPAKYSVEDGSINCSGLWNLRIDNNHDTHVVVFLGDLGRDLYSSERLYWQSFNVPPEGKISDVNKRRSFDAEFTDPSRLDLLFKYKFSAFQEDWEAKFGWPLFKPLAADDLHYYKSLHIPLTNDRSEFDDQVLALAKIMVDSINESKIQEKLPSKIENEKGISKFERFLKTHRSEGYDSHITFLRNLYKLRHGAGHRKGEEYKKISDLYKLNERELMDVFKDILQEAILLIDLLQLHLSSEA